MRNLYIAHLYVSVEKHEVQAKFMSWVLYKGCYKYQFVLGNYRGSCRVDVR